MSIKSLYNNTKIYQRLWFMAFFALSGVLLGDLLSILNMHRAKTIVNDSIDYASRVTEAVDTARSAQVHFKKQVQEWKNVLLRGNSPQLYDKYWSQFQEEERSVHDNLKNLKGHYKFFELETEKVEKAIETHKVLGEKYRKALNSYRKPDKMSAYRVDASVRGIDREPTDYIDTLVDIMRDAQARLIKKIRTKTEANLSFNQTITLSAAILSIILTFLISYFTIRSINRPIDHTIKIFSKISEENYNNKIQTDRRDEIGEMWIALDQMQTRLKERTEGLNKANEELAISLDEVKKMKEEQDGDYFLTYLLTAPLGSVHVQSETVHIDSVIDQKKKFKFRKYSREIGGDINIAHRIPLQNRNYLVFLNGDAMGKSIQGAGGALVLGSVFQSIIQRTLLSPQVQSQYPEKWLRNAFVELHKVFESFDGSMLMSAVFGLIDEKAGIMYFINAEHPHLVLYRDSKASFIEQDDFFRKLGHTGLNSEIFVGVFKLEPGDVVISGSDGRDDLLLGTDDNGARIINEDEKLFLKKVEEGKGDIHAIKKVLESEGELTDDLSLLRIGYREKAALHNPETEDIDKRFYQLLKDIRETRKQGNHEELEKHLNQALALSPRNPEVLQLLTHLYIKRKNFKRASLYARRYVEEHPHDNEFLYLASYTLKMSSEFDAAAEFGERLRLRDRKRIKNLINLADIHSLRNNFKRASYIVSEALVLDPDNDKAMKLEQVVAKHMNELHGKDSAFNHQNQVNVARN